MEILILVGSFCLSLFALVVGAGLLLRGAERIGKYFKLPSFVIGALIVGVGTSLPELAASIAAVLQENAEIVVANAVGSNIANILLVTGLSVVIGRKIVSTKNLLDLEIPLLVISTALFLGAAYDGNINFIESLLVFVAFLIYFVYLVFHGDQSGSERDKRGEWFGSVGWREFLSLIGGTVVMALGARYLIEVVINLAEIFSINPELISISALAIGTSLPEVVVSIQAVIKGKTNLAFGNIFGSNVLNILMLVGVVGLFSGGLPLDEKTLTVGLPFFAVATFIFISSVTSKKIYIYEGLMFLIFYAFFLIKIFEIA